MYALKTLKPVKMPNGTAFPAGQTCHQLSREEAVELLAGFPDFFEPADPTTIRLADEVSDLWFEREGPMEEIFAASRLWVIAFPLASLVLALALVELLW